MIALCIVMAKAFGKRWAHGAEQVIALPSFEALRDVPPHHLLRELQRVLLVKLAGSGARHFQGLAQAGKAHDHNLDGRLRAKLRLVDDSTHLIGHLTPESATEFVNEIDRCVSVDGKVKSCRASLGHGATSTPTGGGSNASGDSTLDLPETISSVSLADSCTELEPDTLESWWANEHDSLDHAGVGDDQSAQTELVSTVAEDGSNVYAKDFMDAPDAEIQAVMNEPILEAVLQTVENIDEAPIAEGQTVEKIVEAPVANGDVVVPLRIDSWADESEIAHDVLAGVCEAAAAALGDAMAEGRQHQATDQDTLGDAQFLENSLYSVEDTLGRTSDADDRLAAFYFRAHDVRQGLTSACDRHWGRHATPQTRCSDAVAIAVQNGVALYREWVQRATFDDEQPAVPAQPVSCAGKEPNRRRRKRR